MQNIANHTIRLIRVCKQFYRKFIDVSFHT